MPAPSPVTIEAVLRRRPRLIMDRSQNNRNRHTKRPAHRCPAYLPALRRQENFMDRFARGPFHVGYERRVDLEALRAKVTSAFFPGWGGAAAATVQSAPVHDDDDGARPRR